MIYFVKFSFLPLLIHFTYNNIENLLFYFNKYSYSFLTLFEMDIFLTFTFPFLFYLFLSIDTFYFVFGYLIESEKLNNKIKSVDTTFLGWFFALICYPPYNFLTTQLIGWHSNDFATSQNILLNYYSSIFAILFFLFYVIATINLGKRSSNMTNRGIVDFGIYKFVRHPAYISKNIAWLIMGIPFIMNFGYIAVLSLIGWSFIYFMRALTEERHLGKDINYIKYKKKVKYMFIPKIF